jgi:hypothetical protein
MRQSRLKIHYDLETLSCLKVIIETLYVEEIPWLMLPTVSETQMLFSKSKHAQVVPDKQLLFSYRECIL